MKKINFESITLRLQVSTRGGGIEISLDSFGKKYIGQKMTAYQNYLGGGMLGRIANDCTVMNWRDDDKLDTIAEKLREYFHELTNPEGWESVNYEQNQSMQISAY